MNGLAAWYDAQPAGDYTCSDCGKIGPKHYVQPQRKGGALCSECINARNARARTERKATLAAMPRCEVPGCRARATYTHNGTGICGRHLKRARAAMARRMRGMEWLAFGAPTLLDRDALIRAALDVAIRDR
jgi:hypothetical protein